MKKSHLLIAVLFTSVSVFNACKKEEPKDSSSTAASVNGKRVSYSVTVVSAGNSTGLRSSKTNVVSGAVVTANQNGEIRKITTDDSGLAIFPDLKRGNITVTVKAPDHATITYRIDLTDENVDLELDSLHINEGRYASTIVSVLPKTGNGTAILKGKVRAELDITNASTENAPAGTKINAYIMANTGNTTKYIDHLGSGKILNAVIEDAVYSGTVTDGIYSITVPASPLGIDYSIIGDDFSYDVVTGPSTTSNQNFIGVGTTRTAVSNRTTIADLAY